MKYVEARPNKGLAFYFNQNGGTEFMNMPNPATYESRDIYLSASLKASGVRLVRVTNREGKGFFCFENSPKIDDLIARYHNDELKINAKTLFAVWKDLKSLAFSAVGGAR